MISRGQEFQNHATETAESLQFERAEDSNIGLKVSVLSADEPAVDCSLSRNRGLKVEAETGRRVEILE